MTRLTIKFPMNIDGFPIRGPVELDIEGIGGVSATLIEETLNSGDPDTCELVIEYDNNALARELAVEQGVIHP